MGRIPEKVRIWLDQEAEARAEARIQRWKEIQRNKARWDGSHRKLIGARVKPEIYDRVCQSAKRSQRSMYRLIVDAVLAECDRVEHPPWEVSNKPDFSPEVIFPWIQDPEEDPGDDRIREGSWR